MLNALRTFLFLLGTMTHAYLCIYLHVCVGTFFLCGCTVVQLGGLVPLYGWVNGCITPRHFCLASFNILSNTSRGLEKNSHISVGCPNQKNGLEHSHLPHSSTQGILGVCTPHALLLVCCVGERWQCCRQFLASIVHGEELYDFCFDVRAQTISLCGRLLDARCPSSTHLHQPCDLQNPRLKVCFHSSAKPELKLLEFE